MAESPGREKDLTTPRGGFPISHRRRYDAGAGSGHSRQAERANHRFDSGVGSADGDELAGRLLASWVTTRFVCLVALPSACNQERQKEGEDGCTHHRCQLLRPTSHDHGGDLRRVRLYRSGLDLALLGGWTGGWVSWRCWSRSRPVWGWSPSRRPAPSPRGLVPPTRRHWRCSSGGRSPVRGWWRRCCVPRTASVCCSTAPA